MHQKIIHGQGVHKFVTICDHCGNETPQNVLFKYSGSEEVYTNDGEVLQMEVDYYLTLCGTCENIILYSRPYYYDEMDEDNIGGYVLYPSRQDLSRNIPDNIRKSYKEALKISKIAPNAYAVEIRKALEFMCLDKKADGKNLMEKISNLIKTETIPPVLAEMTNGLRILGNHGAHAVDTEISVDDVRLMDDFFKTILEYVYVAPNKLAKFKERLEKLNR